MIPCITTRVYGLSHYPVGVQPVVLVGTDTFKIVSAGKCMLIQYWDSADTAVQKVLCWIHRNYILLVLSTRVSWGLLFFEGTLFEDLKTLEGPC